MANNGPRGGPVPDPTDPKMKGNNDVQHDDRDQAGHDAGLHGLSQKGSEGEQDGAEEKRDHEGE